MEIAKTSPRSSNFCAFCKYWYDPTNSAIEPMPGNTTVWKFDKSANNKCSKLSLMRKGHMGCGKYECKV